jgi:hypothetical protein
VPSAAFDAGLAKQVAKAVELELRDLALSEVVAEFTK